MNGLPSVRNETSGKIRHLGDVSNALFANIGQLDDKVSRNTPAVGR
jgi:hypothetical protein